MKILIENIDWTLEVSEVNNTEKFKIIYLQKKLTEHKMDDHYLSSLANVFGTLGNADQVLKNIANFFQLLKIELAYRVMISISISFSQNSKISQQGTKILADLLQSIY